MGSTYYTLTLDAQLTVSGAAPSLMKDGKITGNAIVFSPPTASDGSSFTWEGGTLDTAVTLPAKTKLVISTATSKLLKQKMLVNSLEATWDGLNTSTNPFYVEGANAKFIIGTGAKFIINATGETASAPSIDLSLNAEFYNFGTMTISTKVNDKLAVSGPGWMSNRGLLEVKQGELLVRMMQNAGTIDLAADSRLSIGVTGNQNNVQAILNLDPRTGISPAEISLIRGAGKLYLTRISRVEIFEGKATVANVFDRASSVHGAGDLVITGNYEWQESSATTHDSSGWAGSGTVYVGTDTERSAKLTLLALNHVSTRPIINYGTILWKTSLISATVPPPPADMKNLRFDAMSLEIKGKAAPNATFTPSFEIESAGDFEQKLVGNVTNRGFISTKTDKIITIDGDYTSVGGKHQ